MVDLSSRSTEKSSNVVGALMPVATNSETTKINYSTLHGEISITHIGWGDLYVVGQLCAV